MSSLRSLARVIDFAVRGTDPKQRLRITRSLMAAAVYVGLLSILAAAAALGLVDPNAAALATVYIACGPVAFYAVLRSGWNLRCQEPALTFAQMVFAVSAIVLAYSIVGPLRSALLLVLTAVMAFGMFSLTPQEARRLTHFAITSFVLTMAGLAVWRPFVDDPRLELIHGLMIVVLLFVIGTLSSQFARLRMRLREQRAALRDALARLEALVRHDALTGLVNRRCMVGLLASEQQRRSRDPEPACLCAIDLDHFKRINDQFGHAAGDAVLRRFAAIARASLRSVDVLARWGGEEFLLLLPSTDAAHATALLTRLRDALADPAAWADEPQWRVTFSAGVTQWRPEETPEPAIDRADRAAYLAKARGRDGWCIA